YAAAARGIRVLDRALLALQKGLAGRARDMLLESDIAAFGARGMFLELELLLRTGRAQEVREWTDPGQADSLGAASYPWLRAQALASSGDYAAALEECNQMAPSLDQADKAPGLRFRELMAQLIGRVLMDELCVAQSVLSQV